MARAVTVDLQGSELDALTEETLVLVDVPQGQLVLSIAAKPPVVAAVTEPDRTSSREANDKLHRRQCNQ
jgi:hypothetical protein